MPRYSMPFGPGAKARIVGFKSYPVVAPSVQDSRNDIRKTAAVATVEPVGFPYWFVRFGGQICSANLAVSFRREKLSSGLSTEFRSFLEGRVLA